MSPVQDERLLAHQLELDLRVEQRACFSERTLSLRLEWTHDSASLAVGQRARSLPRQQAQALAEQIFSAAERPEVPLAARSTTSYHAALRWRCRASSSGEWTSGETECASRDLPLREVQELVKHRPDLAARIPSDAYARAIGLYELVATMAQGDRPLAP